MRNFMAISIISVFALFCFVGIMFSGCNSSDTGPSEESELAGKIGQSHTHELVERRPAPLDGDLHAYLAVVEGKMDQLKVKHVKLLDRIQRAGLEAKPQAVFATILDDLKKKREKVQTQIELLKSANGKDWATFQMGMNLALEELAHSYDWALSQFAG